MRKKDRFMCEQILQTQDLGGGKNLVQFLSVNSMANHFHIFLGLPKIHLAQFGKK